MGRKNLKAVSLGLIVCFVLVGCFLTVNDTKAAGEKPEREYEVVVVGGGIAGLTCGYFLRDQDILILEQKNTVGGRTISAMHKTFTYAKGTEYIGKPENSLTQMIDELNLEPKEVPSPMDAYFDGNAFYYGSDEIKSYLVRNSSMDAYDKFTGLLAEQYAQYEEVPDLEYNEEAKRLDHVSARKWLRENEIPEVFAKKYNVTSKGLFGATLDEISALSFIPEAKYDYEGDDGEETHKNFGKEDFFTEGQKESSGSYSFAKGLSELTNKLGEVLRGKIQLNSTVVRVVKDEGRYAITYVDGTGKGHTVRAKKVVLAVPAPVALNIAPAALDQERVQILHTVKYSSYATVALFSETPIFDKAFDLAVPDEYFFTDVYDATWVERFYDEKKRGTKEYIASVYVAPKSGKDHGLDAMSDEELLKNIYNDLEKIFPGVRNKVTGYDIERFPHAYPIMSLGAYERLMRLDKLNHGSLVLAGDYLVYPTFEAAVQSGHLAATRILEMVHE